MTDAMGFYGAGPVSQSHIVRRAQKEPRPGGKEERYDTFWANAREEYEICSKCPYPECRSRCRPKTMRKRFEMEKEIRRLLRTGMNEGEIAKSVGCSRVMVASIRRRMPPQTDPCLTCWTGQRGICRSGTCTAKQLYESGRRHGNETFTLL